MRLYGEALAHERQIQGWSRKKKEALIRGDYEAVVILSKSKSSQNKDKRE